MKKRYVGLLIAAALMVQPMTAFAAGSVSSRPSSGGSSTRSESLKTGKLDQSAAPVVNNGGAAGNSSVSFATDTNALRDAGLSWDLIEKINTINAGTEALYRTIGTTNMVGYAALAPVQTALAGNGVSVNLYVPNLVEGLNDVQVLYYNQATKAWELMAPSSINYATKEISVNLSGTTPFTIVYKK
ncbi:hypothetical protein V3C10_10325 [[Clostridium] symbiosum]|uniref:hypothetical protein n=1 Tax=Clostridium symbiosum TaxID=1512 RepID=UPI001D07D095|nr:hypothetical protein [[Clostridium] symbiosum]MCB6607713.1 hypothetical protein [[Clostridium] symbiosum]MCB6932574.1 hypothetical protein [[Clostridium] symbiosum]